MEFSQLKYFMEVAKLASVSKASNTLHIAQPAISTSIINLERELKVKLFERDNKGMTLNENGMYLFNELKPLLETFRILPNKVRENDDIRDNSVIINIGAISHIVAKYIVKYKQQSPKSNFKIYHDRGVIKYDILIDTLLPNETISREDILLEEPLLLAVPMTNPLAEKDNIDLIEAMSETWICLDLFQPLRHVGDAYCSEAGFYPIIAFETTKPEFMQNLTLGGMGVAFWPKYTWPPVSPPTKIIGIRNPSCMRAIKIVKSRMISSVAYDFYTFLRENIEEFMDSCEDSL
ncbi:MAG: LysR family transcriptional regulator [Clostridiales Family XIII bacterium]|jgi:DNA-binding transcriptional LysR family regulator|nr:LysR family transcriptional regulator [Clostridiales Family XIII bacterium]